MTGADARFTVDAPSGASALVVVGGWHGARDKNVKKYTDEFNKWGVATVRTIMPGHLTFSPVNSGRAAFTRDLLLSTRAARQTHGLADKPLYFMFMSNGGCWIWATMHVEGSLDGEFADLGRDLSGVIFDSSPAFMTVGSGAKVLRLGAHPALALARLQRVVVETLELQIIPATHTVQEHPALGAVHVHLADHLAKGDLPDCGGETRSTDLWVRQKQKETRDGVTHRAALNESPCCAA